MNISFSDIKNETDRLYNKLNKPSLGCEDCAHHIGNQSAQGRTSWLRWRHKGNAQLCYV